MEMSDPDYSASTGSGCRTACAGCGTRSRTVVTSPATAALIISGVGTGRGTALCGHRMPAHIPWLYLALGVSVLHGIPEGVGTVKA
jgi:hypothetical protein